MWSFSKVVLKINCKNLSKQLVADINDVEQDIVEINAPNLLSFESLKHQKYTFVKKLECPNVSNLGYQEFKSVKRLTLNQIQRVQQNQFKNFYLLTYVELNNTITLYNCFDQCISLQTVIIPKVQDICLSFSGCIDLKYVDAASLINLDDSFQDAMEQFQIYAPKLQTLQLKKLLQQQFELNSKVHIFQEQPKFKAVQIPQPISEPEIINVDDQIRSNIQTCNNKNHQLQTLKTQTKNVSSRVSAIQENLAKLKILINVDFGYE
uniref:Leucine rich repeats-containing protein n=1 Tax=Trepomonas sp. PC1 TaxID=1076344 RepID=A0A146K2L5_9EUKA|eukprot:JAP89861.1 Hypothetical protein TPC1_30644 [Trepomonas sp. PC1]